MSPLALTALEEEEQGETERQKRMIMCCSEEVVKFDRDVY